MAMKRILQLSVVLTVIACGVLYGQRALVSSAPMAVAAASLSQFAEPDQVPADQRRRTFGGEELEIGPVAGLTTAWHHSPDQSSIPLGSTVQFRVVVAPRVTVTWIGATEAYRDEKQSVAFCEFNRIGQHAVRAEVVDAQAGPRLLESVFDVVETAAADITITPPEVWVDPVVIDENLPQNELNQQTMSYFFGDSIAALRDLGNGRYRTSTGRLVHMSAQADPAGFSPLIEWRLDGKGQGLGTSHTEVFLSSAAVHDISVGPTDDPAEIEIGIYGVVITGHVPEGDIIPEGVPVTFTAVTDPPGHEEDITWLASTKYGTGVPVLGSGPTFTTQFDDVWGFHPELGSRRWLGVKADNSTLGQDQKATACCEEGMDPFGSTSTIPSSITFGSDDILPIPSGFFGEGSDPVEATVELIGFPRAELNDEGELEQCGTADTFVSRLGPVICPDGPPFPTICDPVDIEIAGLSLVGIDPIVVTFNGGQDPQNWLMAMAVREPQALGELNAILESPAGGTYTALLPVEPVVVFVRESATDPNGPGPQDDDIKELTGVVVDMGLPGPVPWSRIPPGDGGFECPPQGFDVGNPFFPGEGTGGGMPGEDCTTCILCSGAGCHGGAGHTHCICRPITCPNRCALTEAFKIPFPVCAGPNFAPPSPAKTLIPCNPGMDPAECCASPRVPPAVIGLFPCGVGLSLTVWVNNPPLCP